MCRTVEFGTLYPPNCHQALNDARNESNCLNLIFLAAAQGCLCRLQENFTGRASAIVVGRHDPPVGSRVGN